MYNQNEQTDMYENMSNTEEESSPNTMALLFIPWEANMSQIIRASHSQLGRKYIDDTHAHVKDDILARLNGKELMFPVTVEPASPHPKVKYNLDNHPHYWNYKPLNNIDELVTFIMGLKYRISQYSLINPHKIWEGGIKVTTVK